MVEKKIIIGQQVEMQLQKAELADKKRAQYTQKQPEQVVKEKEQVTSSAFVDKKQHPFAKDNKTPSAKTKGIEDKKSEENAVAFTYYLGVVLQKVADLFYENLQRLKQFAQSGDDEDLKPLVIADLIQSIDQDEKKIPADDKVFATLREKLEAEFDRLLAEYQEVLKKCIQAKAAVVKKCVEVQQVITNTLDQNGVSLAGVNTPYTQNPQQWIIDLLAPQPPKQARTEAIKRDIVPSSVVSSDSLREQFAEILNDKVFNDEQMCAFNIHDFNSVLSQYFSTRNKVMDLMSKINNSGDRFLKERIDEDPDLSRNNHTVTKFV